MTNALRAIRRFWPVVATAVIAMPALAQDAADWDLTIHERQHITVATIQFSSGLGIAVRCIDQAYEAFLEGLPEPTTSGATRPLRIAFGDKPMEDSTWSVADEPTIAVSSLPAPFARALRSGGKLQIVVPGAGENGRNLRYVMDLPASNTAIDQTLAACERPLVDPRDAELADMGETGLPGDVIWRQAPRPTFPGASRYAVGFAVVSCLTNPDGHLRECVIESEHPHKAQFGRATLRSLDDARLALADDPDATVPPGRVLFRINFQMQGGAPRTTGRRINPPRNAPIEPGRSYQVD